MHSSFLQALGYAIACSFWQFALIWLMVILINYLFPLSSSGRYRIALLSQLAGFTWFIITARSFYTAYGSTPGSLFLSGNAVDYSSAATNNHSPIAFIYEWLIKGEHLYPYLSAIYLLFLVVFIIRYVIGYRYVRQIRVAGLVQIDKKWEAFVNRTILQLGIRRKVSVYLSTLVKSPLTIGYFKPLLLIPVASMNHLTVSQMEAVILHELTHIKRADYLFNLLQSMIDMVMYFNPFNRLLSSIIRKERENACDDKVLEYAYSPDQYAKALLQMALLQKQPVMAMHLSGNKQELLQRVKRMLPTGKSEAPRYFYRLPVLSIAIALVLLTAWMPRQKARMSLQQNQPGISHLTLKPIDVNKAKNAVLFPENRPVPVIKMDSISVSISDEISVQSEESDLSQMKAEQVEVSSKITQPKEDVLHNRMDNDSSEDTGDAKVNVKVIELVGTGTLTEKVQNPFGQQVALLDSGSDQSQEYKERMLIAQKLLQENKLVISQPVFVSNTRVIEKESVDTELALKELLSNGTLIYRDENIMAIVKKAEINESKDDVYIIRDSKTHKAIIVINIGETAPWL